MQVWRTSATVFTKPAMPRLASGLRRASATWRQDDHHEEQRRSGRRQESIDNAEDFASPASQQRTGAEDDLTSFVLARYLDRDGFMSRLVDEDRIRGLLVTGTVAPDGGLLRPAQRPHGPGCHRGEQHCLRPPAEYGPRSWSTASPTAWGTDDQSGLDRSWVRPQFAVRCLDEDRITKVRRQLTDARGRTDENSVTSGEHIRGLGIEQLGEIVSKISGQITGVPLTFTKDRKRAAHITGSDRSVKLHLARTAHGLMEDLKSIEEVCAWPDLLPGPGFIAQVRPVSPKSDLAQHLDAQLDAMIGGPEPSRIALAVLGECWDRFEFAECSRVTLAGSSEMYDELHASQFVAAIRDKPEGTACRHCARAESRCSLTLKALIC